MSLSWGNVMITSPQPFGDRRWICSIVACVASGMSRASASVLVLKPRGDCWGVELKFPRGSRRKTIATPFPNIRLLTCSRIQLDSSPISTQLRLQTRSTRARNIASYVDYPLPTQVFLSRFYPRVRRSNEKFEKIESREQSIRFCSIGQILVWARLCSITRLNNQCSKFDRLQVRLRSW